MSERVPKKLQARYQEIISITDAVCLKHLNDEYAEMSRKMTAALARKRPSPLEGGRANSWACGVVYTIGFVNFLFDKSQSPYMSAQDLCAAFGVSKGTGYNASKKIRDLFSLFQLDPNWTLPGLVDQNPLAWLISVNGLVIDARHAPRPIQEEAYRKKLIPYLPSISQQGDPENSFNIGESVKVKAGVKDPDFDEDISGWQGRVLEIKEYPSKPSVVAVQWDSLTLRNMSRASIAHCEKEGWDWTVMNLSAKVLDKATARDSIEDVAAVTGEISTHIGWLHLGEEGERIQRVLDGINPADEDACLEAWFKYLSETLIFPFDAELTEDGYYSPIRIGDIVKVISMNKVQDDLYGALVVVKKDRKTYQLPLADLEINDHHSPQYQVVRDYAIWFANR